MHDRTEDAEEEKTQRQKIEREFVAKMVLQTGLEESGFGRKNLYKVFLNQNIKRLSIMEKLIIGIPAFFIGVLLGRLGSPWH